MLVECSCKKAPGCKKYMERRVALANPRCNPCFKYMQSKEAEANRYTDRLKRALIYFTVHKGKKKRLAEPARRLLETYGAKFKE